MNEWIKKSIDLANAPSYLDALSSVYVMNVNPVRPLPKEIISEMKEVFEKKESAKLIRLLIQSSEVFPVKDSYVGFLRLKPSAIDENPITINRIASRLYTLGFESMLREAQRPKDTNRQLGNAFQNWLKRTGHKFLDEAQFKVATKGVWFLDGGDKTLANFSKNELKCKLKKGIDVVAKINGKYVIGEAKFLTTPGGEQNGGFEDASSFVSEKSGNASRIAILDGYIWLESLSGLHDKIIRSNENIMSALLFDEYVKKFK